MPKSPDIQDIHQMSYIPSKFWEYFNRLKPTNVNVPNAGEPNLFVPPEIKACSIQKSKDVVLLIESPRLELLFT